MILLEKRSYTKHFGANNGSHLLGDNRFACIKQLEDAVQKKKGGYSWAERREWLSSLYTCLRGPNCYFLNDGAQASPKNIKKMAKYKHKLKEFQRTIEQERGRYSSVYTYLLCVRDLLNKTEYYPRKKTTSNPLAAKLQADLWQALNEHMEQNPESEKIKHEYQRVLKETFQDKQNRLYHPVFFLLLPYYLFIKLGQCEGLISREYQDPFSIPQMSKLPLNWNIRNSLINADDEETYDKLDELYDLIQDSLCRTLRDCGHHSIGKNLIYAFCYYADKYKDPAAPKCHKKDVEGLSLEYAADFSAPFWEYDIWVKCFCEQFNIGVDAMRDDIIQIFNLSFRPSSGPAERRMEKILQKYSRHKINLRTKSVCLSKLLKALCSIYSFQNFDVKAPFANKSLRESIDLLLSFLAEYYIDSSWIKKLPVEEKWLYLIEYGYSTRKAKEGLWWGNIPDYFINPSRVLYRALWMRSSAQKKEIPSRYGLSSFFPYSKSIRLLADGLYHALCSEKEVLRDVAFWGGIEVKLDKEYMHDLGDAFHVWSVWHTDAAAPFEELQQYIKNETEDLSIALSNLPPFRSKPVKFDVFDMDYSSEEDEVSDEQKELLDRQKEQLFTAIPKLKKFFGLSKNLDGFRYSCILYFLFRGLRDDLCYRSFKLYMKLMQLQ